MKPKIIKDFDNKLFNRRELEFFVEAKITPSYKEIKDLIIKEFSADEDVIKINLIKGKFGTNEFLIKTNIYATKEDLIETEKKSKRELALEKEKESASEEKTTETSSEEKTNEKSVEEKTKQEEKTE